MRKLHCIMVLFALSVSLFVALHSSPIPAQDIVTLGRAIFFDTNLSATGTQSCASCHDPAVGFTGPDSQLNAGGAVYEGAVPDCFGNRKPPAAAYAGNSPNLHYDGVRKTWVGGMFWDGRATGSTLGDPLAEQAQGPFLNPLEQCMPDARAVCVQVKNSTYANLFLQVWGPGSLDLNDVNATYARIARSVAAYERSSQVNPFSSKFDQFWDRAKKARKDVTKIKFATTTRGGSSTDPYRWEAYRNLGLTDVELQGLAAFNDPNRANCASCHTLTPGPAGYPLFTDFSYHNLGIPKNPANPFYTMPPEFNLDGANWVDYGLGAYLSHAGYNASVYAPEMGKFKVPTLRNVDRRPSPTFVKAYGHNGYFKSLADIIRFYAWRGMGCGCGGMGGGGMGGAMFPSPEVNQNLAPLKSFSMMDQPNILAFLKTLSDQ